MAKYRVLLDCRFPSGLMIDGALVDGFYTARVVEATTGRSAQALAIQRLQAEAKFRDLCALLPSEPRIVAEETSPAPPPPAHELPPLGFVFYPRDPGSGMRHN